MLWVNYYERKGNNILLQISYSRTKSLERKSYWKIVCFIVVAYSERNKIESFSALKMRNPSKMQNFEY